jgi:hypothetical protein
MQINKTENFFTCECTTNGILIIKFEDDIDKEIYLAIYTYGQFNKKPNLLNRLKYCWYHLRTGKKFEDQIVLNFDKAKEMGNYLVNITNE